MVRNEETENLALTKKIRVLMATNNDKTSDIAKVLGISRQSVWNKITQKTYWTVSDIKKLMTYYQKDANYFL